MSEYWEKRYAKEGRIWSDNPSRTVDKANDFFQKEGLRKILIPGSGYGRNADYFASRAYDVTGIEISKTALALARKSNSNVRLFQGSILDVTFQNEWFDGIYCFNVLHLFLAADRKVFIHKCYDFLRPFGLAFFVVFSELEANYGKGRQIEENTFETKPGRPAHYFTEEDLLANFKDFQILETGLIEEPEDHGDEGQHLHILRYFCGKKSYGNGT